MRPLSIIPILRSRLQETDRIVERWSVRSGDLIHYLDGMLRIWQREYFWQSIDCAWLLATDAAADAAIDLKNPGGTTGIVTVNNAPVFTARRGYLGNGTSTSLVTGYNPSSVSLGMTQDSAHAGLVVPVNTSGSGPDMGSVNQTLSIRVRNGTSGFGRISVSAAGGMASVGMALPSHAIIVRDGSTSHSMYSNGALNASNAAASTGIADTIEILKGNGALFTNRTVMLAHVGRQLTAAQASVATAGVRFFCRSVGVQL